MWNRGDWPLDRLGQRKGVLSIDVDVLMSNRGKPGDILQRAVHVERVPEDDCVDH